VDRAVHPVHGSTVHRPFKTKGYLIWAIRAESDGPARARAMGGGDDAGERRRAAEARRREPWTALPAIISTTGWGNLLRGRLRTWPWGQWERLGLTGGQHRTGAARSLRRARGGNVVREKKRNWVGDFTYHAQRMTAGQRVERRRQRGKLVLERVC
jgi:hypothetical protein